MIQPRQEAQVKILLMDNMYLTCFACRSSFETKNLKPEDFILSCMHYRCQPCTSQKKPCMSDQTTSKFEIDQSELESFLASSSTLKDSECSTHNLPLECYCKSCHKLICYRCITFHKNHEIFDESQLNDLLLDYKKSFNLDLNSLLLNLNQKNLKMLELKASIKESKKNIKNLRLQMIEELNKCCIKYEDRLIQERKSFQAFNRVLFDKFRRVFEDCLLINDVILKGRNFLQKKKDFLAAAEKQPKLLFIDGALEIQQIRFQSIPLDIESLPHHVKLDYTSLEELRYLQSNQMFNNPIF